MGEAADHNPGGKVNLPLPSGVWGMASYGEADKRYRYVAAYTLDSLLDGLGKRHRTLMVVGMNPSTADANSFDPTVAKLWRMCIRNGYTKLIMTNSYAYRATDQNRLLEVADPIGPGNDQHLLASAGMADTILMAYGTPKHRSLQQRGIDVANLLLEHGFKLHALKLSKDLVPYHPLYLPEDTKMLEWPGPGHALKKPNMSHHP